MLTNPTVVLELKGISKQFSGISALSNVDLRLYAGEVHTLMGQNGAGKSTLIKVLTGVHAPDQGDIYLGGRRVQPGSTLQAQDLGISTVYQEVNLCPNLSVAENIFIGRYPKRFGVINWKVMRDQAIALLRKLNVDIDVTATLSQYSLAIQQMVAIARALSISARVLILDEPTSSLDEAEVQLLFGVLRNLRAEGMAILFVTHFLEQTYAISDRITVMRNGEREGEYRCSDLSRLDLVNKMVGVDSAASSLPHATGAAQNSAATVAFLQAEQIGKKGAIEPFDLTLQVGELLGFCGLLGSGRTEAARLLFGADQADSGSIRVHGQSRRFAAPRDAIAQGIGFCSEDRKLEGAILNLSVRENMVLALQARNGMFRKIALPAQQQAVRELVQRLGIKTADIETPMASLSGGNQQKVLLARWLLMQPHMLILDEPTRGIDVRAKLDIMDYIIELARSGMSIVLISSELSEVLRCSDRVMVFRDRRVCGEYRRGELNDDSVLQVIAGHQ